MNYVQVRFESNKIDKAIKQTRHNTRASEPPYLRKNEYHNKFNNTFILFNESKKFKVISVNDRKIELKLNMYIQNKLNDEVKLIKSETKNFRLKKHAITQDCVITLSNSINDKLKKNEITQKELDQAFYNSVYTLEKELNIKALNMCIHYDEKTPHCHVQFRNYYRGKSITNRLKKSYSKAQDLVGECFTSLGYKRGVKKSKSTTYERDHMTIVEMHQAEIKQLENKTIDVKHLINLKEKYIAERFRNEYFIDKNKINEFEKINTDRAYKIIDQLESDGLDYNFLIKAFNQMQKDQKDLILQRKSNVKKKDYDFELNLAI